MTNNIILPILLQILGAAVIIAEFIVPSMGILTVTAIGLIGYSLYIVFTAVSVTAGFVFVFIDILFFPILVIVGIKLLAASPVTLRTTLKDKEEDSNDYKILIGKEGKTVTDLYPVGIALIENSRTDVISRGDYIEKGTRVKVVSVNGNKIMVDKIFND